MRDTVNRNVASTKLPFKITIQQCSFLHFRRPIIFHYTATVRDNLKYFDLFTQAKTVVFIYMTKKTSNR